MSGEELREILIRNGYILKEVASLMGMSQPNFSQLMRVQDVKTGTLEEMCKVLGKSMGFFYSDCQSKESHNESIELAMLKGQVMAYQDALDRIGRSDKMAEKKKEVV